jgi:transposase-like protein
MKKKKNNQNVSELCSSEKTIVIQMLQEQNNLLKEKINRIEAKLKVLEGQRAKNSRNSHKPPSSDNNKPKKTQSLRKKSGKKPGGQVGHKGHTLEISATPDTIITLPVDNCEQCGGGLKSVPGIIECRQEFEIPEPKMCITEYQSVKKTCNRCCCITKSEFPDHITQPTQYGFMAKSLMVYLNQYQLIPFDRVRQFFKAVYGQNVSVGTVMNAVNLLYDRLDKIEGEIKSALQKTKVANCDETGVKISGDKHWLHTVGNEQLTHYAVHKKRGSKATQEIGILPEFKGTMVHDHWKSYFTYKGARHALCNAHHLRELNFVHEHQHMKWAKKLLELLVNINEQKKKRLKSGKKEFLMKRLNKYNAIYDGILQKGKREQAVRGTLDSKNLLKRLTNYKAETLLFMNDFDVPFTNNLSEGDIRMTKVQQKISGGFRTNGGADNFCRIRGVMSSARKNGKSIFDILKEAFQYIISLEILTT